MNEKLLQYLWQYKIFRNFNFKDTEGNNIDILDFGQWNSNSGPDFLCAKIKTKGLTLVGNIEIHLKSSDFLTHKHNENPAYKNLILHVVYEHDIDLELLKHKNISTLELANYVDVSSIDKYKILSESKQDIPCKTLLSKKIIPFLFFERTLLKKLEEKSDLLSRSLKQYKNDYEAVLFHRMAYAFGLKTNAEIFQQIAEILDFSVIRKVSQNLFQLEALFFGTAGWLEHAQDETTQKWQQEYRFLQSKHRLSKLHISPKFLRMRPANFPTIRLAQLAQLYHCTPQLFSKIITSGKWEDLSKLFEKVRASSYWDNHYKFGKFTTKSSPKTLSEEFINRILINTVLPFRYFYYKNRNEGNADEILDLYKQATAEDNYIMREWKSIGIFCKNALESQALLWYFKNYCIAKKCLNCDIGYSIIKKS